MKDSQLHNADECADDKYIKANNERFSTNTEFFVEFN